MSSQQHTGAREVCCWYLGARPIRGARARARACARGPPRPYATAQTEQKTLLSPYTGPSKNIRRTRTNEPRTKFHLIERIGKHFIHKNILLGGKLQVRSPNCTPLGVFGSFECRISNEEDDSE